jgi:2-polyprenyl-6-methoxyphenol hydroxylase-like FAD-dependent oxidoreductase
MASSSPTVAKQHAWLVLIGFTEERHHREALCLLPGGPIYFLTAGSSTTRWSSQNSEGDWLDLVDDGTRRQACGSGEFFMPR